MSNTVTLTFNSDTPIQGKVINLNQIDSLGQQQTITFTYGTFGSFVIIALLSTPYNPETQIDLNTENCYRAFQRDLNPSLYSVTRTDNEVIVTTLTDQFTFEGADSDFDGVSIVTDYTPLEGDGLQRIHARSPYFILAPISDSLNTFEVTSAKFDIYIYEGVLDVNKPSTPTYTYEKKPRYANDTNIYIDISRQISDFIDNKYNGVLQTDCVFVEIETTSTYSGGTLADTKRFLALNGYNLHEQNVNHIPTENILLSNSTVSVLSGQDINIPVYIGGGINYNILGFYNGESTPFYTEIITDIEIINTNDVVNFVNVPFERDGYLRINNTETNTPRIVDVEVVTECIYDPVKITFVNRFGVLQDFYSYKVSKETIKATNDSYNRSILQEDLIGGLPVLSYQTTEHRTREYNRQATRSIELNTGYIAEDNNVIIEEMLTSEYIWLTVDGVIIPANLSTKSVQLLTKTNDQLIKYKLNFDYSYNEVQNIR